jgi:Tfp pilus assembly protein PilF
MNLGITYFGKDYKSAEKELRRALELKPDSPNILNALGCVYLEQDRLQEASKGFQDAIAIKPNWTDPHFNYGRLLKKLGRNDEALAQFQKAVEVGPLNASAHLYLAQELAERGNDREAEAQYRQSIQLSPSLVAQRDLVDILLRAGQEPEATEMLRQMAKDYPFDSATHLKLARVWEKRGKAEEAKQEYKATLNSDPANAEAQSALKQLETPRK